MVLPQGYVHMHRVELFQVRIEQNVQNLDRDQAICALIAAQEQGLDVEVTAILHSGTAGKTTRTAQIPEEDAP